MDGTGTESNAGKIKPRPGLKPQSRPAQNQLQTSSESLRQRQPAIQPSTFNATSSAANLSSTNNPSGQRASTRNPHTAPDKDAWLRQNTGLPINAIRKNELEVDPAAVDSTSSFEILCSYNWHDSPVPSIYVPGAPPRWTPQSLPLTLPEDEGGRYIDQNAHRVPAYPFEPLFRALAVNKPDHKLDGVDFVANRNSMRKLLNFVSGKVFEPFRIDLDMVNGKTLFMTRREKKTKENKSGFFRKGTLGYGHQFEKHFTEAVGGLENSTSHHQVARYMFGDLDCVIRYEVDAWMPEERGIEQDSTRATVEKDEEGTDLLESLQKLSLGEDKEAAPPATRADPSTKTPALSAVNARQSGTQVILQGPSIDSSVLVELKSKAKAPRRSDIIPQLWFGRIPYLAIGIHEKGTFHNVSVTKTEEDFKIFESRQQDNLRKIVQLIKLMRKETMAAKDQACVIVCDPKVKPLNLMMYSVQKKRAVLPQELIQRHWGLKV